MSRTANIMNRIELAAKKFEMDIENLIDILEGKSPTHHITATPVEASPNAIASAASPTSLMPTPAPSTAPAVVQASNTLVDSASIASSEAVVTADTTSIDAATQTALDNEDAHGTGTN